MISRLIALVAVALFALDAHAQADPSKLLRVVLRAAETGFDPQVASDLYSNYVNRAIFEAPFRYDFRARPHRVVPNTAVELPQSKDGMEWTIRIRPGIYFTDDPVFKGKKRELTAADYAYSWKRLLDPKMRAPALELFDGRIVGMDALLANAKANGGKFDYDAPVEGLQVVDKYTLKLKLTYPWWNMVMALTDSAAGAVAREVIEAYGDGSGWAMANPVGTGPYKLKEWRRGLRIGLEANPGFRGIPYVESNDPADKAINARFRGKTFPLIGRVELYPMEESGTRILAFEKEDLDYLDLPTDLVPNVMQPDNTLKPRFTKAGVLLDRGVQPSITYTFFNMEDPVVGGYTKEKIALRRAIGMGYNVDEEIRVIRQGQATFATMVVPPGVSGHDPKYIANTKYDPDGAKALLDKFGYVDRDKDGWRDLPDGKPLVLRRGTSPSALERQYDELWQRNMAAIGLKTEAVTQKWPDLLKMARNGQLQIWFLANTATTTDGYAVLGLLYGGNAGLANLSRFKHADFDRMYDESKKLPDGPPRDKLVKEMSQIVAAYAPWKIHAYRIENVVVYPWVVGYKYNAFNQQPWQYLDIDLSVPRRYVQ